MSEAPAKLRIDKWLWQARFFKTRSLAAKVATGGHVRLNGQRVAKASVAVGPGDVLTFPQARAVRVVRILALGDRRGPSPEARALYDDLSPPEPAPADPGRPRPEPGGRPTGKDRRRLDQTRGGALE
ncbi:RNA-binding S4 domain-containing protein [Roseivivax isoporae]|uniref:tRNA synthetase RNA-binding protein n=1 Tax=Roseivivax isoporae LMG 25204 TaxID=1449351 RepID=X7FB06_9RHOB|nr:RNA-binding S4 domain-containing protein [Roseivivax isoporae]ETX29279.1 tRNA synthetase RNA-binding protein [Roseivivax isoporae LMG 25204]